MKSKLILSIILLFITTVSFAAPKGYIQQGMIIYRDDVTAETLDVIAPVKLFEEFASHNIAAASDTLAVAIVGSGTMTQTNDLSGIARITTTATVSEKAEIASPLLFRADKFCTMEARVRINQTTTAFNVGFTDAHSEASGKIAVSVTDVTPVITSNASNFAGFVCDVSDTSGDILALNVNDDTDGTPYNGEIAFTAGEWHTFYVSINDAGDADFWIDTNNVATIPEAVSTTVPLCTYMAVINRESVRTTMDIDYLRVWQRR